MQDSTRLPKGGLWCSLSWQMKTRFEDRLHQETEVAVITVVVFFFLPMLSLLVLIAITKLLHIHGFFCSRSSLIHSLANFSPRPRQSEEKGIKAIWPGPPSRPSCILALCFLKALWGRGISITITAFLSFWQSNRQKQLTWRRYLFWLTIPDASPRLLGPRELTVAGALCGGVPWQMGSRSKENAGRCQRKIKFLMSHLWRPAFLFRPHLPIISSLYKSAKEPTPWWLGPSF